MTIRPGLARKSSTKNPPFLSHEFVIQNHADIVSCAAMVFVVGLMLQATSSIASVFIAIHHNVTGTEPSQETPRGTPFLYESGWKDGCAVFFYTLICIIMHAILQEYVLDKISKKLHLSKFKLSRFNESGQLVVFYAVSFFLGFEIITREGYFNKISLLWEGYPEHPMGFLHKFYFILQLAYYAHMLPELYFQKVKKEDQKAKIIHAVSGFALIGAAYFLNFQRIALLLSTIHYFSEIFSHTFQLVNIFDKDEKFGQMRFFNNIIFVITRFATMVLSVLTLFYGIENSEHSNHGLIALFGVFALQGHLVFQFMTVFLKSKRDSASEKLKKSAIKVEKTKKDRKKESDLPEADQAPKKLKSK